MKFYLLLIFLVIHIFSGAQITPSFTIPDTVCVDAPVTIKNTTTGASNYYWSFCAANIKVPPVGVNIGNPSGGLATPVYSDVVSSNGNYYVFITNNNNNSLTRLSYGTSLANSPVPADLTNLGALLPPNIQGIQVVNSGGRWFIIVVGGDPMKGNEPKMVKLDFGVSLTNPVVSVTDWGNIDGNLFDPHDLTVFNDGTKWYGFVANYGNSTISEYDFGTDFSTQPVATNLGSFGVLNAPTGVCVSQFNNKWYAFVTASIGSPLVRLEFGNGLSSYPTKIMPINGINNVVQSPRDMSIIKYCDDIVGYIVNGDPANRSLVQLDFFGDLTTNSPTATSMGNVGNTNIPNSISKFIRSGPDLYSFITNVGNNTITRIKLAGCTNASIPASTLKDPPPVKYTSPGTYTISLTVNEGLPTQASLCKQIVVKDCKCIANPDFSFLQDVCNPQSIQFTNVTSNVQSVSWAFGDGQTAGNNVSPTVNYKTYSTYPVKLVVTTNTGCKDSVTKNIDVKLIQDSLIITRDTVLCGKTNLQLNALPALTYCWSPAAGLSATNIANPIATITQNTTYYLNARVPGTNLITNGNFSQGNTGFTSAYQYSADGFPPAVYFVGTNPQAWNPGMPQCKEHTPGGNGNMMMVNGSVETNVEVWTETITVKPNTSYAFSTWLETITYLNPAQLQFSINGKLIGPVFTANNNSCVWDQFYTTWNSGDTNKARISIVNMNSAFSGNDFALDDISFAETSIVRDSVTVKITDCTVNCDANPDFSFVQDACNPKSIQFTNETKDVKSVAWFFGDGQTAGNNVSPTVNYKTYNTYTVKLVVTTNSGCKDSVTKDVAVNVIQDSLIITGDTVLCSKANLQLNALSALTYCWSPATGLSATNIANPVASVTGNTTYYVTSQVEGTNLIINGDFSQGNTGFKSDYVFANSNNTEGQYFVGKTPSAWNPVFSACGDHTTGTGNMLMVNGNQYPGVQAWSETVVVQANTNYVFSGWLKPIYAPNPAQLQFYINGKTVGNVFTAVLPTCNWQQFFITWNSGDTNKANISVINKNTILVGNDFALDDISFAQSFIKRDSVNIKLASEALQVSADTSICSGGKAQIVTKLPANSAYNWLPATGLNNAGTTNPVASPTLTTTYVITAVSGNGCKLSDSVKVSVLPQPTITTIADTAICAGSTIRLTSVTVNGNTFSWLPVTNLNDATQQSPVASPANNIQYIVTVNQGSTCFAKDTVNITINPAPGLQVSNDTTLCGGGSVQLLAASSQNVTYNWSPSAGLSNTGTNNPVASPAATTKYYVQVKGNTCSSIDSVVVAVLPQPTVATIADTVICAGSTIKLTTVTVNGNTFSWLPVTNLNDATQQNPVASPSGNTQYIVTVSQGNKCFAKDTVNITVNPAPGLQVSNDTTLCGGGSVQLKAASSQNVTYNWSPSAGLSNTSTNNPVASPAATTKYYVQVKGNSCSSIDSVVVAVLPQPTVATIADTVICAGATIQLNTTVANGTTYNWLPATGLTNAMQQSPVASPTGNTQYIVTVNRGSTCFAKDTVLVTVNPLPVVQAFGDTTLCAGTSTQINAVSTGNITYNWLPVAGLSNPAINNPVASPASTTTYTVQVTDVNKCTSSAPVTIVITPQPVFGIDPPAKQICVGEPLTLTASGGDIYQWSPAATVTSPNAASTQVSPLSTTTYAAVITNNTCKITGTVYSTVTVSGNLAVSLSKSNDIDCVQGSATLQASGGNQYTWSPTTNINYPNIANPVVSPLQTTTYYVLVKKNGCTATDSITVVVNTANADNGYKMPSAFTPNGDNVNDCFGLKYWGGVKTLQFEVYNRWGNRLFYTSDPSKCWDGTYKGINQPPGTYVYQIRATTICGNVYKKGTIVLIR